MHHFVVGLLQMSCEILGRALLFGIKKNGRKHCLLQQFFFSSFMIISFQVKCTYHRVNNRM